MAGTVTLREFFYRFQRVHFMFKKTKMIYDKLIVSLIIIFGTLSFPMGLTVGWQSRPDVVLVH